MKRVIYLALIGLLCASCSTLQPSKRITLISFVDYRQYEAGGFMISPDPYAKDFESLGEIDIIITPAIKEYPEEGQPFDSRGKYLDYENISHNELVRMAVDEAKSKGADALVNFKIVSTPISRHDSDTGETLHGYEHYISGYCIKRK